MMEKNHKEQLCVFGYGLALLIPFFIGLHSVKPYLNFWPFVAVFLGGFSLVMVVISQAAKRPPVENLWIWVLILAGTVYVWRSAAGAGVLLFCGLAHVIIGVTLFRVQWMSPVYTVWMRGARLISQLITGLILTVLFYSMFAIAGLVLRVLSKDLLGLRKPVDASTFWIRRPKKDFVKEDSLRQF